MAPGLKHVVAVALAAGACALWLLSRPVAPSTRAQAPRSEPEANEHPQQASAAAVQELATATNTTPQQVERAPDAPATQLAAQLQAAAMRLDASAVLEGEASPIERPGRPFGQLHKTWREEARDARASQTLRETLDEQIDVLGLSPLSLRVSCGQTLCRITGVMKTLDELQELRQLPYAENNSRLAYGQPALVEGGVLLVVYDRLGR